MELSKVHYIVEAENAKEAEALIERGWRLINIVATTRPNGQVLPCYILGRGLSQSEVLQRSGL